MRDKNKSQYNYFNFPLMMLTKTITAPQKALHDIYSFGIVNYAKKMRNPEINAALVQLCYVAASRPSEALPLTLEDILDLPDVQIAMEDIGDAFSEARKDKDENFTDKMKIYAQNIELSSEHKENLVYWYKLRQAAQYLKRVITNHEGLLSRYDQLQVEINNHKKKWGENIIWCSIPADFFLEKMSKHTDEEELRLLRIIAACRSVVGRSRLKHTNKLALQMRSIGAKNRKEVDAFITDPKIEEEYEFVCRRRRIDNVFYEMASRGFVTKFSAKGRRGLWLSTTIRTPQALAKAINKNNHHKQYRKKEKEAAAMLE